MTKQVKVKKSELPESTEILASAIINIGNAVAKLENDSGINKNGLIILLQAHTKLSRKNIETVIDALPQLRRWYCK